MTRESIEITDLRARIAKCKEQIDAIASMSGVDTKDKLAKHCEAFTDTLTSTTTVLRRLDPRMARWDPPVTAASNPKSVQRPPRSLPMCYFGGLKSWYAAKLQADIVESKTIFQEAAAAAEALIDERFPESSTPVTLTRIFGRIHLARAWSKESSPEERQHDAKSIATLCGFSVERAEKQLQSIRQLASKWTPKTPAEFVAALEKNGDPTLFTEDQQPSVGT